MGVLTDDMTRLRGEIAQLHGSLEAFVATLAPAWAAMKADFQKAHRQMAKKTAAERAEFVKAHRQMAKKTAAERAEFVSDLVEKVAGLRNEFAADIAGAHRAWFGSRRPTTHAGGGRAVGRRSKAKAGTR